jgi:hypothetical protein
MKDAMRHPEFSEKSLAALAEVLARPGNDDGDVRFILMDSDEQHVVDLPARPDAFVTIGADLQVTEESSLRYALVTADPSTEDSGTVIDVVLLGPSREVVPRACSLPDELWAQVSH